MSANAAFNANASFFDRHRLLFEYDTYGHRGHPKTTEGFIAAMQALMTVNSSAISSYDHLAALIHVAQPNTSLIKNQRQPLLGAPTHTTQQSQGSATAAELPSLFHRYNPDQPLTSPPPASVQPAHGLASMGHPFHASTVLVDPITTPTNKVAIPSLVPPKHLPQRPYGMNPQPHSQTAGHPNVHTQPQPQSSQAPSQATTTPLLDSSLRVMRGRKVDLAQKIEQLVGPKFGRVVGPSNHNLPTSIKRRLDAYYRLDDRKEALYQLLRAEYVALQRGRQHLQPAQGR
ncbi:hypothetical protein H257_11448 [Aphanomyces astaci]|uniref:Uncharacterized protein n=1 Tax=Aphanomyces astaci TaxID=112090 RepID=W4G3Z4_APHAT|nr:hypothetical protein H257_11448 [Aphanomyces astaci]ETV73754.1 hypothetical protein H257_11448 [Aphanomyces astaci]|eukprot:XP_009836690.1 hypothetical protein H257_11448 [Aphanomyces astaci]